MLRFNDIADRMIDYNSQVDLERLQRAYVFTAKVHDGQERLSGEPYLIHPLEVAGILLDLKVDEAQMSLDAPTSDAIVAEVQHAIRTTGPSDLDSLEPLYLRPSDAKLPS